MSEVKWDPVLVKLARLSPPEFALTIRRRNQVLLRRLNLLDKYAGMDINKTADEFSEIFEISEYGCPHCEGPGFGCHECDWKAAGAPCPTRTTTQGLVMLLDTAAMPCTCIRFPSGLALSDMHDDRRSLNVVYDRDSECVEVRHSHIMTGLSRIDITELAEAKAFVQDHIDWADLECWGADYCRTIEHGITAHFT